MATRSCSICLIIVIGLTLALTSCVTSREAQIMTYEEYARIPGPHKTPYILRVDGTRGSLLYFGAEHSVDPGHPQVAEIVKQWAEFRPTVAYAEGGIPSLHETLDEAVRSSGEGGPVRFLAERDRIPVRSLEPPMRNQVEMLVEDFSPEQVKLHYLLRQVMQYRREGRTDSLELYLEPLVRELNNIPELDGPPRKAADIKESVRRVFPGLADWTRVPQTWFSPTRSEAVTNKMARELSRFRDEHMVSVLIEEVEKGERVFAVVGFSHAIMQAPALRNAIE